MVEDFASRDVHVENCQVGAPLGHRRGRFARRHRDPRLVGTVPQRELHDLGEHRVVDHQERSGRTAQALVTRGHGGSDP